MATLLSYGTLLRTRRKTVTAQPGTSPVAGFPLTAVNDDVLGSVSKLDNVTGGWGFDMGASSPLHFLAVGNHNTSGTISVYVQASNDSDFSTLAISQVMAVASPNFWIDLRPWSGINVRYVRYYVTGNAANLYVGEIVAGTLVEVPSFQWDYTAPIAYLEQLRGQTPYGGYFRRKHNVAVRGMAVRFVGGDATMRTLWNVGRQAQTSGGLVVMMPDDSVNDAWFIDWPDPHLAKQIADNRSEFSSLTLQEQSPGLP